MSESAPSESLDSLFRRHHQRVYAAAFRVTGTPQDAEDALQSVFLRVLKGAPDMGQRPESYLCRAAINAALDLLRARSRAPTHEAVDIAGPDSADADIRQSEMRRQLRTALSSLRPRAAEIFALRYFEDFNNTQIAHMLDTSSSSIAVTLHRTRERLADMLREYEGVAHHD